MSDKKVDTFEKKAPEILTDLAKHVEKELVESGMENDNARFIAMGAAVRVAKAWGGNLVYIPLNVRFHLAERDVQIYNEFNGTNHRELAKKYGISIVWLYQIIRQVRRERSSQLQPQLFENDCE